MYWMRQRSSRKPSQLSCSYRWWLQCWRLKQSAPRPFCCQMTSILLRAVGTPKSQVPKNQSDEQTGTHIRCKLKRESETALSPCCSTSKPAPC